MRLFSTNAERERIDEFATLFGIITSLDYLERAYVRDSITQSQSVPRPLSPALRSPSTHMKLTFSPLPRSRRYAPACSRLLAQYKTIMKLVGEAVPSLEGFMSEYKVSRTKRSAYPCRQRGRPPWPALRVR